jgi:translation elongation factor EF-1alpha
MAVFKGTGIYSFNTQVIPVSAFGPSNVTQMELRLDTYDSDSFSEEHSNSNIRQQDMVGEIPVNVPL